MKFNIGDRIWFPGESRPYRVRVVDQRFVICTKPFNPKRTVLYTIIDLEENIRGTEDLIFCMGFETDDQCMEAMCRLILGQTEVSHRNRVKLDILRHEPVKQKEK